jgi:hypothetical protein
MRTSSGCASLGFREAHFCFPYQQTAIIMLSSSARIMRLLPAVFVLALGSGCSEKSSTISGKLVLPSGVKLEQQDSVTVGFLPDPAAEGKTGATAAVNIADSTFTAKDLKPGKYKLTVNITPYPGDPNTAKRAKAVESLNEKHNAGSTKLRYDVTNESQQSITVDLTKDSVSKG